MTTVFDKPLLGYRFVLSNHSDSLQRVALRELGDASKWTTLVAINQLLPPYLTDDPAEANDSVVLNGTDYIIVPAAQASTPTPEPIDVFGTDILLSPDGLLATSGGDFASVSGLANLNQALSNALATDQNELLYHPQYGSLIRRILGTVNGPTAVLLAAEYAKSTVAADARISQVVSSTAQSANDAITVAVQAETIAGSSASFSTNIQR